MSGDKRYNQIIVYLIIYFFFNGFLLPEGLLYTIFLTPIMVYFLFKERKLKYVYIWSIALLLPIPFQIVSGVEISSFIISNIMIFTALIFFISALFVMQKYASIMDQLFRKVLIINSLLVFLALLIVPFESVRGMLWYDIAITKGLELIPRLKLFTYEASYYSLIMMPVFLYFFLRVFYDKEKHPMIIFIAVIVPLLLSLSFGVMGALVIAFVICVIIGWKRIPVTLQRFTLFGTLFSILIVVGLLFIWPENPIYFRLTNIFKGEDTSAMGRLYYSFMFATDLVVHHNILFGIGPGQVKIVAHDMIVNHYKYHGTIGEVVRIPNSMAEMLSIYGVYGLIAKLFLEVYFFVKLRIYNNLYALILFVTIFIYQFTGSYISNVAELGIWAIVFGISFKDFDFVSNQENRLAE